MKGSSTKTKLNQAQRTLKTIERSTAILGKQIASLMSGPAQPRRSKGSARPISASSPRKTTRGRKGGKLSMAMAGNKPGTKKKPGGRKKKVETAAAE